MENQTQYKFEAAEIQIVYKTKIKATDRPKVTASADAVRILRNAWNEDHIELFEEFKVMFLNRANRVLGILSISQGGFSATIADPKLIFGGALKTAASGIILAHNHPSGNLTASQADLDLTKKCKEAGRFLEIQVLDHIILTKDGYLSLADEGTM